MKRKITTEEWIQKAYKIHGDKYNYNKVEYKSSKEKVCIICPEHGEFWQTANNHLNGQNCPKCALEMKSNNLTLTTEDFIKKASIVHNNYYDYSKVIYVRSDQKVIIICPEHGEFEQIPSSHLRGYNCPKCSKHHIPTTEEWIEEARKVHGNKYDYSKSDYIGSSNLITIICPIHGEFQQIANNHLRGNGCLKCKNEYMSKSQRNTIENFIEKANRVHDNKYDYSDTTYGKNNKEKVIINCLKHGKFLQTPHDHLLGYGCPKCQLKSQTKLYEKLKESFPNEEILFEVGRNIIPWIGLQRFDIYFPKYNIAVEYNGEQHYIEIDHFGGQLGLSKTIERDELKRQKCKENNCSLFEIRYDYSKQDYENLVININKIIDNYETKI